MLKTLIGIVLLWLVTGVAGVFIDEGKRDTSLSGIVLGPVALRHALQQP